MVGHVVSSECKLGPWGSSSSSQGERSCRFVPGNESRVRKWSTSTAKVFPRRFSELEVSMMHKPWPEEVAGKAQGAAD